MFWWNWRFGINGDTAADERVNKSEFIKRVETMIG